MPETDREQLEALQKEARRAQAEFKDKLGDRSYPTWYAVNVLQKFTNFVALLDLGESK